MIFIFRSGKLDSLNVGELESSILFLGECLRRAYHQKVVILIDEIDAPLNSFVANRSSSTEDKDRAFGLINVLLLNAFKKASAEAQPIPGCPGTVLAVGLMTGILPFTLDGLSGCDPGRFPIDRIGRLSK
jgi:hypothetical protein